MNDIENVSDASTVDNDGKALIIDLWSIGGEAILNIRVTVNENTG